jgi:hypothetical protein
MIVASTGRCNGSCADGGAGGPLPHSSRIACANDDTGFHSAITRSQCDIGSVGANVLARNVIGNNTVNTRPLPPTDQP